MEGIVGSQEQPEQRPFRTRNTARTLWPRESACLHAIACHKTLSIVVQAHLRAPATSLRAADGSSVDSGPQEGRLRALRRAIAQ